LHAVLSRSAIGNSYIYRLHELNDPRLGFNLVHGFNIRRVIMGI